jgi:inner membrane protein
VPRAVVAGEVPLQFWKRRMIWRSDAIGGTGTYDPLKGLNHAALDPAIVPLNMDDPRLAEAAKRDPHVGAFLFWSRLPLVVDEQGRAYLTDQRFYDATRGPGSGTFLIPLDNPRPSS